jgi:hypothetical protein
MAENNKIQDPRNIGVSGLNGIRFISDHNGVDQLYNTDELPVEIAQQRISAPIYVPRNTQQEILYGIDPKQNVGFVGVNDSRLDKGVEYAEDLYNLPNFRGEEQSNISQIANAFGQGITTAGTTFLNGTVGLLYGAISAGAEGDWSKMWDNDFSQALNSANKWAEEAMPMHMTDRERESVWNQGFGNLVGNLLLKPAGFVAGAALSGGVWAKGVTAAVKGLSAIANSTSGARTLGQISDGLNMTKNWINAGNISTVMVGGVTSAAGEAGIEALNNSNEKFEANKLEVDNYWNSIYQKQLEDIYRKIPDAFETKSENPMFSSLAEELAYNETNSVFNKDKAYERLEQDRIATGNLDYLLNVAILSAGNVWQFGRFYSRGFNANKRALNNIAKNESGSYIAENTPASRSLLKLASNSLVQGQEEMSQKVAAHASSNIYDSEFNSFYGARIVPTAEEEAQGFLKAITTAAADVYTDKESYFEFLSGALMGVGGSIRFQNPKKEGKYGSPIYFESIRDDQRQNERTDILVDQMNERVSDPKFKERYQGFIRHKAFENAKTAALNQNDQFTYENADYAQFLSDIIMFDKAGQIQDLNDTIDAAANISDEDIASLKKNTTGDSGTSPFDGMTNDEIRENFANRATQLKEDVSEYVKNSRNIETSFGDIFQANELEEMTYMVSQIGNFEKRFGQMHEQLKETLSPYIDILVGNKFNSEQDRVDAIEDLTSLLNSNPMQLLYSIVSNTDRMDVLDNIFQDNKNLLINSPVLEKSIKEDIAKAKEQGKDTSHLLARLEDLKNDVKKSEEITAKFSNMARNISDMQKIAKARSEFIIKYNGYRRNPQALRARLAEQEAENIKQEEKNNTSKLKEALVNTKTTKDFDAIIAEEKNAELKEKVINDLIKEENPIAVQYKEESDYVNNISTELDKLTGGEQSDAKAVYNKYKTINTGLVNIANPNAVYDATKESLGLQNMSDANFELAKNNVISAIFAVNNNDVYRKMFDQTYKTPSKKATPTNATSQTELIIESPMYITEEDRNTINNDVIDNAIQDETNRLNKYRDGEKNYFLRPAISKTKPTSFWGKTTEEKAANEARFNSIFDYLVANNAFDFVDSGKLTIGTKIRFAIEPSVNNQTVFMVAETPEGMQIVGSLNESGKALTNTPGLKQLLTKIRGGKASPEVEVTELLVGKLKYGEENKPIKDIPNTDGLKLGVVKNGNLNTNGAISASKIELSKPLLSHEGAVFMLTPTIRGTYRPIALSTARFNSEILRELGQAPMYMRRIRASLEKLIKATNDEEKNNAINELGQDLYVGDVVVDRVTLRGGYPGLRIADRTDKSKEAYIQTSTISNNSYGEFGAGENANEFTATENNIDIDSAIDQLAAGLANMNLPIQVAIKDINKGGYNTYLRNSNVLSSNVIDAKITDNWFITSAVNPDGTSQSVVPETKEFEAAEAPLIQEINISESSILRQNKKETPLFIKLRDKFKKLYPEIKLTITNNPLWEKGPEIMNQEIRYAYSMTQKIINDIEKIESLYKKIGNNDIFWSKLQKDYQISKNQIHLLRGNAEETIKDSLISFVAEYSFGINTDIKNMSNIRRNSNSFEYKNVVYNHYTNFEDYLDYNDEGTMGYFGPPENMLNKSFANDNEITFYEFSKARSEAIASATTPSNYYKKLVAPGGRNYRETEINIPYSNLKIIGHAKFSTPEGIGWFRSDDSNAIDNQRRILEFQSDLFQQRTIYETPSYDDYLNSFLELLKNDNQWVKFFIQSIIQDSAMSGYNSVLFPSGNTIAIIEGFDKAYPRNQFEGRTIDDLLDEIRAVTENTIMKNNEDHFILDRYYIQDGHNTYYYETNNKDEILENLNNKIHNIKNNIPQYPKSALSTIRFYDEIIKNTLYKLYGKESIELYTDQHSNSWFKLNIDNNRDLSEIQLQTNKNGQIIGQANLKALSILLDAVNMEEDTLPHEYAHHYISWFRDSEIVQEGIKRFGSEEALVDMIGKQVVAQEGEVFNWWKKFTQWIINLFSDQDIIKLLTDAFLTRRDISFQKTEQLSTQQINEGFRLLRKNIRGVPKEDPSIRAAQASLSQQILHNETTKGEALSNTNKSITFADIPAEMQEFIGMTEVQFNNLSTEEKEHLIKCSSIM